MQLLQKVVQKLSSLLSHSPIRVSAHVDKYLKKIRVRFEALLSFGVNDVAEHFETDFPPGILLLQRGKVDDLLDDVILYVVYGQ